MAAQTLVCQNLDILLYKILPEKTFFLSFYHWKMLKEVYYTFLMYPYVLYSKTSFCILFILVEHIFCIRYTTNRLKCWKPAKTMNSMLLLFTNPIIEMLSARIVTLIPSLWQHQNYLSSLINLSKIAVPLQVFIFIETMVP